MFSNFFQKRLRRRHLDSSNDLTSTFASFLQINFTQSSGYSTKSPIEMYSLLIRQPFPSAICCLANSRLPSLSIDLELLVLGTTLVSYLSISELNCKKKIYTFFKTFTLQKKKRISNHLSIIFYKKNSFFEIFFFNLINIQAKFIFYYSFV